MAIGVEAEDFQIAVDAARQRRARDAAKPADQLEVLTRGEVGVEARLLRDVADNGLICEELLVDIDPAPADASAIGPQQADDHPDRGALATAVRAEQPDDRAGRGVQRQRAHGGDAAIAFPYLVDVEHVSLRSVLRRSAAGARSTRMR